MTVNGKKAINMVSTNFLGVAGDPKIQASKPNAQQETLERCEFAGPDTAC